MVMVATRNGVEVREEVSWGTTLDRRRGNRVMRRRPAKVLDVRTRRYFAAETLDVSESGLRLSMPAAAPVVEGLVIHVLVAGPGDLRRVVATPTPLSADRMSGAGGSNTGGMVAARVVWVRRAAGRGAVGSGLTCGVEFVPPAGARSAAA